MIKVGIIGATGYVGAELMRILLNHRKLKFQLLAQFLLKDKNLIPYTKTFSITLH